MLKTITSDNGRVFADHAIVAEELGVKNYFALSYRSWEHGSEREYEWSYSPDPFEGAKIEGWNENSIRWIEDDLKNRSRRRLDHLPQNEYLSSKFNIMRWRLEIA